MQYSQQDIRRVIHAVTSNADACSKEQLHAFYIGAVTIMTNALDASNFILDLNETNGIKAHSNILDVVKNLIVLIDSMLDISIVLPKLDKNDCRHLVEQSLTTVAETLSQKGWGNGG